MHSPSNRRPDCLAATLRARAPFRSAKRARSGSDTAARSRARTIRKHLWGRDNRRPGNAAPSKCHHVVARLRLESTVKACQRPGEDREHSRGWLARHRAWESSPSPLLMSSACSGGSTTTSPSATAPAAAVTTEVFAGTVPVNGSDIHNFNVTLSNGQINVILPPLVHPRRSSWALASARRTPTAPAPVRWRCRDDAGRRAGVQLSGNGSGRLILRRSVRRRQPDRRHHLLNHRRTTTTTPTTPARLAMARCPPAAAGLSSQELCRSGRHRIACPGGESSRPCGRAVVSERATLERADSSSSTPDDSLAAPVRTSTDMRGTLGCCASRWRRRMCRCWQHRGVTRRMLVRSGRKSCRTEDCGPQLPSPAASENLFHPQRDSASSQRVARWRCVRRASVDLDEVERGGIPSRR